MTELVIGFSLILYGQPFHTYKVYLIDFMSLNLEKNIHIKEPKKFSWFTLLHRPLLTSHEGEFQGFIFLFLFLLCSFFPQTIKMHLKKSYKKTFCENLFSRLDKILDFSQNRFSRTSLNFAKSAKIYFRKSLFLKFTFRARIG